MERLRKFKKILIILFFSILLLSTVISFDSSHMVCCHEKDCSRCDIIKSSINLLDNVKSILFVTIVILVTSKFIEFEIKRSIKLEKITLIKNKVVLLE